MDTPCKLAAILAADVAGYSRLMGIDEAGTAKALREHRAAIDPIVASHGGRIVKTTDDGMLVEFPSIVAAVECAIAAQKPLEATPLRCGKSDGNPGAHAPDSHAPRTLGIPLGIQMSDLVH